MKSLLKMTWMEAKLFLREPVGAFFTLIFPLMMLFIFGTIYGNQPPPQSDAQGGIDNLNSSLFSHDHRDHRADVNNHFDGYLSGKRYPASSPHHAG